MLLAGLLLAGAGYAWDETAGRTGGETLQLMESARAEGLLAPVAGGGGLNGLSANPAALAGQATRMVSGMYTEMLAGASAGLVSAAVPAGPVVIALQLGTFGAGEIDVVEESGAAGKMRMQDDLLVGGSVAMPFPGGFSAGFTAKYLRSTLVETYHASAMAFDAGLGYTAGGGDFSVGVSMLNIGGQVKYEETSVALPYSSRAGASWRAWHGAANALLVLGEVSRMETEDEEYSAGLEAVLRGIVIIRAGATIDDGLAALSAGAGLRLRSYEIDYARVSRPGIPDSYRVSAGVSF